MCAHEHTCVGVNVRPSVCISRVHLFSTHFRCQAPVKRNTDQYVRQASTQAASTVDVLAVLPAKRDDLI